jgi:YVTN family beta-propeller protein
VRIFLRATAAALLASSVVSFRHDVSALSVSNTIAVGSEPTDVAFSPDGTLAYVTNRASGTVSIIDTATGLISATVNVTSGPAGVAVSGTKVVVNNSWATGRPLTVIDRATNAASYINTTAIAEGRGVELSADGNTAFMVAGVVVARVNLSTNNVTYSTSAQMSYSEVVVPSTGNYGYLTSYNGGTITKFDLTTLAIVNTVTPGFGLIGAQVTPDGSTLYVARCTGSVLAYDLATDTVTSTIPVSGCPYGVDVRSDGSQVFVSRLTADKVSVIDTATNTVSEEITVGAQPAHLDISPDDSKIYVTNSGNNTISVIDLFVPPTTTTTTTIPGSLTPSTSIAPVPTTISPASNSSNTLVSSLPTTGGKRDPAFALPVIVLGLIATFAFARRHRFDRPN